MTSLDQTGMVPLGASDRRRWLVSKDHVVMVREAREPQPVSLKDRGRLLTIDLSRTAIIVVDMQNDFCHSHGWLSHIGVDITPARAPIDPLKALLPALRRVDVPIIWLNWGNRPDRINLPPGVLHVYNSDGRSTGIGDPLPETGARVLQSGSWAADIVEELSPEPQDIRVDKFRMSGFQDTALDSILRNLDIDTILFAGVNADQCVLSTLQEASARGYDCILLKDCCGTTSPQFCMDATLYNVRQCFGFVAAGSDIVANLEGN